MVAKVRAYQQLGLAGVIVWQVGHEGTSATLSMVNDTINTLWDAVYTQQGRQAIIRGVAWNRILAPRQSTVFGFCVTRQQ